MKLETLQWEDHPDNPLIEPLFPDWMIADPSVLTPDMTPDGKWHLFANAILQGIGHFVSEDGIRWRRVAKKLFMGIRPFVYLENDRYYIFYERVSGLKGSSIACRTSDDLVHFSDAKTILTPSYPWEGRWPKTAGNPCLIKHDGRYRLYYSANWVFLKDCLFLEPKYIGVAESDEILGEYVKRKEPLISPARNPNFRNLGAGSMKVLPPDVQGGDFHAFNNGIYIDEEGHSRSEIHLLSSQDGYDWKLLSERPLVAPTNEGWKRALVYAMHVVRYQGEWRMYYNARDGWFIGKERIGLAIGREKPKNEGS